MAIVSGLLLLVIFGVGSLALSVLAVAVTGILLRIENPYIGAVAYGLMLWPLVLCAAIFIFVKFRERAKARRTEIRGFDVNNRK
jgi:hypothetical protein